MSVLTEKRFHNESAAYEWVEARLWPHGPSCPHCGNADAKRITKLAGNSTRIGVRKCNECRKPFTVKVGTIFESSHVKMHLWLQAIYLMCSSKKGISSNQLHRTLGVTLKTAWFMSHRIRVAMRMEPEGPLGSNGGTVEIDETFIGRQQDSPSRGRKGNAHVNGQQFRNVVLTLVERGGSARSFHVDGTTVGTLIPIVKANIAREADVMTDEASQYRHMNRDGHFSSHGKVNHKYAEYARIEGDRLISTNTVEGYYSIFKRGMKGIYQHCGERHLHRYLAEFDFRYSNRVKLGINDEARATIALIGAKGKRLTYRTTA